MSICLKSGHENYPSTHCLFFKVLNGQQSTNGGDCRWIKNRWMPKQAVNPCTSGYHLCRPQDLISWLGPDIWIAEGRGKLIECEDKVVFEQARVVRHLDTWTDKTARLFACWCVRETPLHDGRKIWVRLADERSRQAVIVAEKFANGEATAEELAAAWDAAWDAAGAAAGAAAWAAQTRKLMEILWG